MNFLSALNRALALPFLGLVWLYTTCCRPLMQGRCRFHPSCGDFCQHAFQQHGFGGGLLLAMHRLLRCHPFHPGGVDQVPQSFSWRRFLPRTKAKTCDS
ncbi:MAG: membrane protein insertion efficiency factor YidD [Myxococcales bacterium]|nr:membrane protein insertion efficiency factor YidD [Myxococcales bacterium]